MTTIPTSELEPTREELVERAEALRDALPQQFGREATRLSLARDQAARKAWAAEQESRAAEQQVTREQKAVEALRQEIQQASDRMRHLLEAADFDGETEVREALDLLKQELATATARHSAAAEAALRLRADAARQAGAVEELDQQIENNAVRAQRAEQAIDALEEKASALSEKEQAMEAAGSALDEWVTASEEGRLDDVEELKRAQLDASREADAHQARADAIAVDETALGYVSGSAETTAGPATAEAAPASVATAAATGDPVDEAWDREYSEEELDDLFVGDDEAGSESESPVVDEPWDREYSEEELDDLFVDDGEVEPPVFDDPVPVEDVAPAPAPVDTIEVDDVDAVDLSDGLSSGELPLA